MTDYVLTGLVKRRAELAGEIEATHARLRKMIDDLEKLDSVILQFDPQHDVEGIKPKAFRPPEDWAHRGEMTRTVLSILRQSVEPMTTRDIALEMLVTRALNIQDQRLLAWSSVSASHFGYSATTASCVQRTGRGSICFGKSSGKSLR
jgi:hypothetical protein